MRIHADKNFNVVAVPRKFRAAHMKAKHFLFSERDFSQLSRKKIFPKYMKQYEILKIEKELKRRGDLMSEEEIQELRREKQSLASMIPKHGELFKMFKQYYMNDDREVAFDILELVESHYLPRVSSDQEQIKELKQQNLRLVKEITAFQ